MARPVPLVVRVGLLLGLLPAVRCYSSGMVSAVCSSMVPGHGGSPQTGSSPYNVISNMTTYQDGDTITVQLQSTGSTPFKGFMLQARELGGDVPLGSFTVAGGSAQLLSCDLQSPNSAVSHTSSVNKNFILATWTAASSKDPKPIEFRATFVQSFPMFWVNVRSPVLNYSGVLPSITPTSVVTTASISSGSSTAAMLSISSAGCGRTKVCFSQPLDCDPAVDPACHFMSASVSGPGRGSEARFEMKGPAPGYVSFGFSHDQTMGNDDIYICGLDVHGLVRVQHAFSTGKQKPNPLPLGNVSKVMGSLQDGVISCSFSSMNPISTQQGLTGFDTPYFLLYAYGTTTNGEINYHTGRFSSSDKLVISDSQLVSVAGKPQSIKTHGALMLIAWMTTASLGMMVARYLKGVAKTHSPFGKAVWFVAHTSLMSLTLLATLIAFIVIFSYVRGWSGGAHPVLGCLVTILALLQPLGALFRCGPDHRMRYVFNWLHMLNALVMKVLAVAAIFTGLLLFDRAEDQVLLKVMGGFVGWEAAFYLSFELYARCRHQGWDIDGPKTQAIPLTLLAVFFLGNLAFLLTLLVGITMG